MARPPSGDLHGKKLANIHLFINYLDYMRFINFLIRGLTEESVAMCNASR
jgi:hypothetical protein